MKGIRKIWLFPIAGFLASFAFLILKAAHVIDWNWLIICLPVIITWGIPLIYLGALLLFSLFLGKHWM
ncbi:MAG: hypothetical protein LBH43_18045 [Treponema sp.]|jgi:hypothetical protein|nr:hypothetical protein [Treponema sp.]